MVKNLPANAGDTRDTSIPGLGRSWRKAWQATLVFLPGESHGQRSLAGYSPQGHKESDTTEATSHTHTFLKTIHAAGGRQVQTAASPSLRD